MITNEHVPTGITYALSSFRIACSGVPGQTSVHTFASVDLTLDAGS